MEVSLEFEFELELEFQFECQEVEELDERLVRFHCGIFK